MRVFVVVDLKPEYVETLSDNDDRLGEIATDILFDLRMASNVVVYNDANDVVLDIEEGALKAHVA